MSARRDGAQRFSFDAASGALLRAVGGIVICSLCDVSS
jgi:hypothetical protein